MTRAKRRKTEAGLKVIEKIKETPVKEFVSKPKISFAAWFKKQEKAGKVRFYQDEALLVFFKKQGLKEIEIADKYDEFFKKF